MIEEDNTAPFDPQKDVDELCNAFKADNVEVGKIVDIICNRKNEERQLIKEKYEGSYGKKLEDVIDDKIGGDLKDLLKGLLQTPVDFDVYAIKGAVKGAGTDEDTLSEIIATRPSNHLTKIGARYPDLIENCTLEGDIKDDTSGVYMDLLIALIKGKRSENPYPNIKKIQGIVEELKGKEGEKINKDIFVKYFANCSYGELCSICRLYERNYNTSILDVLDKEFDKDSRTLMKYILYYISDSGKFFAEKINKFNVKTLNRILISRSEIDMEDIRDAYKDLYKKDLIEAIQDKKYKDDFEKALIILVDKKN